MSRDLLFLCEGMTEELVIEDGIKNNHLKFEHDTYKTKNISPINRINHSAGILAGDFPGKNVFILVHDTDDQPINEKIVEAITTFEKHQKEVVQIKSTPHIETFLACFFDDFKHEPNLTIKTQKAKSELFLKKKMKIKSTKKLTISKVIKAGGDKKNLIGKEKYFGLIKYFK